MLARTRLWPDQGASGQFASGRLAQVHCSVVMPKKWPADAGHFVDRLLPAISS
jgi:hypothetical protein